MAVGSLLILCVFLVSLPLGAGDDDSIQMIIKHQTGEDNLIVNFSLTNFKLFYNCMCPSAWTKCIAELTKQSNNEQRVSKVDQTSINTKTHGSPSRHFTCFHNATSEIIICSMLFHNDDDDADDDDDDEDDSLTATQWFQLQGANCDCVGIKWMHSGGTISSKNNKSRLRHSNSSCGEGNPLKGNAVATKTSTTVSSSHRKRKEQSEENTTQDSQLWIIITTVVVILVVIIVVLLFVVLKRVARRKNYLTKSCREENATSLIKNSSVTYTLLELPVSVKDKNAAELTHSENKNINCIETSELQGSGTNDRKHKNRHCDTNDLCYVDVHDADQHFHKDDNYDLIEDDESDDKQKVQMGDHETVAPSRGHGSHDDAGQDNVYEGYEQHPCEGRFPDVKTGSESEKKIQEATLYSSVDEREIKYTSVVFEETTLDTNATLTDNSYEEMGIDIASSNNRISYEDMSTDNLQKSEQKGSEAIIFRGNSNSEEHYNPRTISNTPGIGDEATSKLVYSTLRNEICKRTHTYDVLCAKDVERM